MNSINVKELREKKGCTQAELAHIMGVAVQTIKNWESGKTIPSTALMRLKSVFNLDENDSQNNEFINTNSNSKNESIMIEALIKQLEIKDKQIERLINIIEKTPKK